MNELASPSQKSVKDGLSRLSPDIPWAHLFNLGNGVETVTQANEQFYKKAVGLGKIGDLLVNLAPVLTQKRAFADLRVLDLACGEGGHSIALAKAGAEVVGIEGRDLYIERASFVADVLGVPNVRFIKGDVRKVDTEALGKFDVVIASGILHHLGADSFEGFLNTIRQATRDTAIIYTHVSTELSVKNHRLQGPEKTSRGYEGYLFREHKDNASTEERLRQVRASLDNTFSFWATPASLYGALKDVGFRHIFEVRHPHVFGFSEASYRPIIVAKV
jgi:SAM-dependent methyltransferase